MDIELLVNLTSKAWSLNILALLHAGTPGRQAPLLAATSASRGAFSASLDHLVHLGVLERNPGHGHPLRPEFRLTSNGVAVAQMAHKIVNAVPNDQEFGLLRRNWSVPILALTATPRRFSMIRSGLIKITDRALSKSLHELEERKWLKREIVLSQRTPFPTYHAISAGAKINKAIDLTSAR